MEATNMPALKKFLFDTPFDTPFDRPEKQEEEKAPEVEESQPEEEAPPTYSEEEVNAAREEGFAAGKKEGIAEAANATEHQIMELLKKMEGQYTKLFRIQNESNSATARDATAVAVVVARKVLPDLNQRNALGEVERFAEMALEKVIKEPHVVMRVNPRIYGPLAKRIDALIAGKEYAGQIKLMADDGIPVGDCRMEWRNGGGERNLAAKMREIDEIIERNLGSSVTVTDGAAGDSESVAGEGLQSIGVESREPPPEQSQEALDGTNAGDGDMANGVESREPPPEQSRETLDGANAGDGDMANGVESREPPPEQSQETLDGANAEDSDIANIEQPENAAGTGDANQGPESGQAAPPGDGGENAAIGEDETAEADMPAPSGKDDGAEETAAGEGTNADKEQAVSSPGDG
ncbi:MAG: FliH/SctL family protein [Rhodospirillales bacterium]|jgi:flagellar assembly protein FliH|nr:FliH/SctL family protein [Rhodospirillales bacterium]